MRSATSRAKFISCVTTTIVMWFAASSFMTESTSPTISGSSAEVGSSKSITRGSIARARAIAMRCIWPPESCSGKALALSGRPTRASSSIAFFSAASRETPRIMRGAIVTLSSTVMCGNKLKRWNTIPMSER